MVTLKMFIINELDIINYKILWGLCMNNRVKIAHEFANAINSDNIVRIILFGSVARGDDGKDSDIDILIVSDYWEEIDSIITDVVGDIVLDQQELISPHIMSVARFNNTKDYSFLTNVLEEGVVLV
jgi:predicted nucleotidyltransferase